jgi:all-trans-8'-apo-beta-carotenal 15,15'-oxygenase
VESFYALDTYDLDQGWVITVVYGSKVDRGAAWGFDNDLLSESLCRLTLPEVIPIGFHGT